MTSGMVPAVVNIIRAVRAKGSRQSFSINADMIITQSSSRQFDSRHFAHHVYDIQWTLCLHNALGTKDRVEELLVGTNNRYIKKLT